jgi:hypothetical protein
MLFEWKILLILSIRLPSSKKMAPDPFYFEL